MKRGITLKGESSGFAKPWMGCARRGVQDKRVKVLACTPGRMELWLPEAEKGAEGGAWTCWGSTQPSLGHVEFEKPWDGPSEDKKDATGDQKPMPRPGSEAGAVTRLRELTPTTPQAEKPPQEGRRLHKETAIRTQLLGNQVLPRTKSTALHVETGRGHEGPPLSVVSHKKGNLCRPSSKPLHRPSAFPFSTLLNNASQEADIPTTGWQAFPKLLPQELCSNQPTIPHPPHLTFSYKSVSWLSSLSASGRPALGPLVSCSGPPREGDFRSWVHPSPQPQTPRNDEEPQAPTVFPSFAVQPCAGPLLSLSI